MTELKKVLKERGMSAYRLAKKCGINLSTMYSMLNGKMYFYPKARKSISDCLGISEQELFRSEVTNIEDANLEEGK